MKNQVTTIEQSEELLMLGVPVEKASLAYTTIIDDEGNEFQTVMERDLVLSDNIDGYAFTVADLLNLLPEIIAVKDSVYRNDYCLEMGKKQGKYIMTYRIIEDYEFAQPILVDLEADSKLINVACAMVRWLLLNKYKLCI